MDLQPTAEKNVIVIDGDTEEGNGEGKTFFRINAAHVDTMYIYFFLRSAIEAGILPSLLRTPPDTDQGL